MTIFDSIRYPLSYPPTQEELEAVPLMIFSYWTKTTSPRSAVDGIKRLRKLIEKYNTDECEIREFLLVNYPNDDIKKTGN